MRSADLTQNGSRGTYGGRRTLRWAWYDQELEELNHLARRLNAAFPRATSLLRQWMRRSATLAVSIPASTVEAERELDALATALRQISLRVANLYTVQVYRSPLDHERPKTSQEHLLAFGYERDIHPLELERRIRATAASPSCWQQVDLLFSSGQAALQAILLTTTRLLHHGSPPSVLHIGSYFETTELLSLFVDAGLFRRRSEEIAETDILLYEPVQCTPEGQSHTRSLSDLIAAVQKARVIICDITLCRHRFDYRQLLDVAGSSSSPPLIVLFRSGLKLDQAGLELANVGIVSAFEFTSAHDRGEMAIEKELVRLRTLTGSGLGFGEINALSAPWFLGDDQCHYADRVFANNESLAMHFPDDPCWTLFHPKRQTGRGVAPFCLLRLSNAKKGAYAKLEELIKADSKRRGVLLQRGGSFGFRGHRYQAIVPKAGDAFLRLSLGARHDASAGRIGEMLEEMVTRGDIRCLGTPT